MNKFIVAGLLLSLFSCSPVYATDKEACYNSPNGGKVVLTVEACSLELLVKNPKAHPELIHRAYAVDKQGRTEEGCWDGTITDNEGRRWIGIAWFDYPVAWFPYDEFKSCITL